MTAPDAPKAGASPVVLIVDDDSATRTLLREIVYDLYPAAMIHEAPDGNTALWLAESLHPDLVLLDIVLPGSETSGVLVCQELTRAQIKVLVVSGNATGSIANACLSMGVEGIVQKPFTVETAQTMIRRCVER